MLNIYSNVTAIGLHNYVQVRIPLPTNLNIKVWEYIAVGYHDASVDQHLKYGFPLSYEGPIPGTAQ